MTKKISLFIVLGVLLQIMGCGDTEEYIVYRDRPVEFDERDQDTNIGGEPEVIIGLFDEQLFDELADGDDVPIVYGLQGGTWLHISVRVFGIHPDGEITVSLSDLATIEYPIQLIRTVEGFFEVYDVPIPVEPPDGQDLTDLFGQEYTLTVSYSSKDLSASATVKIILIDG